MQLETGLFARQTKGIHNISHRCIVQTHSNRMKVKYQTVIINITMLSLNAPMQFSIGSTQFAGNEKEQKLWIDRFTH